MKQVKKLLALVLIVMLSISIIPSTSVSAAKKVKLNKTKATIYVGKTTTLKLKNNKKKVKWSSSNKKVATVSSKGKVKGKKAGKATITAKVGKKKYKCKITVKNVATNNNSYNNSNNNANNNIIYIQPSVKDKIKNACITYGEFDDDDSDGINYYLDKYESIEGNTYYTQVQYYPTTDIIRIALLCNSTYMVYFDYQNTNSTTYPVIFFESENTYYGEGLLYPSLINNDIAVAFTDTNIPYSVQTSAAKLTTSCVKLSLCYFDIIMSQYSVGVTYKDLGFNF